MTKVNLNADMGEGFGAYDIGDDAAMLDMVASANVACGFHAGDPTVMNRVIRAAVDKGVSVGAHPGFNDLPGFGRRRIDMSMPDIESMIAYQIGALQGMAAAAGGKVTHVKPHGALNNMASERDDIAGAIAAAVKAVDPSLILVAVSGSSLFNAGTGIGLPMCSEAYADRSYGDDGNMTSRKLSNAMIRDPDAAAEQVLRMVRDGIIISTSGKELPVNAQSICIHGDEPTGPAVAKAARAVLEAEGIEIVTLPEMGL
jgi:5-oxoprolinase (ATP-hydrolysing) subunit A